MEKKKSFVKKRWTLIGILAVLKEIIEWGLIILQGQDIWQLFM